MQLARQPVQTKRPQDERVAQGNEVGDRRWIAEPYFDFLFPLVGCAARHAVSA